MGHPECNPERWSEYNKDCCSVEKPCGVQEGYCNSDSECIGGLVCGHNNCGERFPGINPDCCTVAGTQSLSLHRFINKAILQIILLGQSIQQTHFGIFAVNPKCSPKTWSEYHGECCSVQEPCGIREGDCDLDSECIGDLVCGHNNCGEGFPGNEPDCCAGIQIPPLYRFIIRAILFIHRVAPI